MEYKIIRHHNRKRLIITVNPTGEIVVKAGRYTTEKQIEDFVTKNISWIEKWQKHYEAVYHTKITVTEEERKQIKKQLMPQMKEIVERYSTLMGVEPKSVKITVAEKRWGSCGPDKALCFSYRCAFLSQRCKEYIVIHELSHIKEFNHSKRFYSVVAQYMPDYEEAEKELEGYYIHLKE